MNGMWIGYKGLHILTELPIWIILSGRMCIRGRTDRELWRIWSNGIAIMLWMDWIQYRLLPCFEVECVSCCLCSYGVIARECAYTRRRMCMSCCCPHGRAMCLNTWLSSWTIVPRGPFILHTVWPWGNNVHVLASYCIHCNLQMNRTESKHKPAWITLKSKGMRMGKRIIFRYVYVVTPWSDRVQYEGSTRDNSPWW